MVIRGKLHESTKNNLNLYFLMLLRTRKCNYYVLNFVVCVNIIKYSFDKCKCVKILNSSIFSHQQYVADAYYLYMGGTKKKKKVWEPLTYIIRNTRFFIIKNHYIEIKQVMLVSIIIEHFLPSLKIKIITSVEQMPIQLQISASRYP